MVIRASTRVCAVVVPVFVAGVAACDGAQPERAEVRQHALTTGSEIALDPDEIPAPISGDASGVTLGSNGTDYLAVWCANTIGDSNLRYAARIAADGSVLDDPPLELNVGCTDTSYQGRAAIAHGSLGYVAVYPFPSGDLRSALVDAGGVVVENGPIVTAPNLQTLPALASAGSTMLLVWADERNGGNAGRDIYAQRLDASGKPVGAEIVLTNTPTQKEDRPAVVFDGSSFLVAWQSLPDIVGVHVTTAGSIVEAAPLMLAQGASGSLARAPALAFNGSDVLLAHDAASGKLEVRRLAQDGSTIGSPSDIAAVADETFGLATNGSEFMVVWRQAFTPTVRAMRVSAAGALLDPTSPTVGIELSADPGRYPALASNGIGYLAGWTGPMGGVLADQAVAVAVSSAGTVGTPELLTRIANLQTQPAAAFDGAHHFVVWQDHRQLSGFDLFGARVTPGGAVADDPALPLVVDDGEQTDVALAFGNGAYLMTWMHRPADWPLNGQTHVRAARVTSTGQVGAPLDVSAPGDLGRGSDVAFGGNGFLVAYEGSGGVRARLFDADGVPAATDVSLESSTNTLAPAVAWGGYYLVAWSDGVDIKVARLDAGGTLLDQTPIVVATQAELNAFFSLSPPAVAFGGGVFLVVFHETFQHPYAKRVSVDGTVLDAAPIPLPDLGVNAHHTSVRFDGTDFVVAYGAKDQNGIHVARVRPDGTVSTEQASFVAPNASSVRRTLRLSAQCGGDVLAVFSRAATTAGQANERAFARLLAPDNAPASPDCTLPPALAPDAGSAGGTGGAAGTSGTAGDAGASSGGSGGSAGSGVGANGGSAAGAPAKSTSGDDGGCSCTTSGDSGSRVWPLAYLALLIARVRRWRHSLSSRTRTPPARRLLSSRPF